VYLNDWEYEDLISDDVKKRIRYLAISSWQAQSYRLWEASPSARLQRPEQRLRKYEALERIDFVTSYKCPGLKQPFRLNVCEDSVCLEDQSVYETFLRIVDLCRAMYPEWKVPQIRLAHYEVPQGWF
jgi:hypothetical protein